MKVCFLGTNGWFDTDTGNTVCVLIETKNHYVIFDAGNGLYKIDKYIRKNKPIFLLLSHYHIDHIVGFHALNKFYFKQGIDVYGPVGLKTLFKEVINKPYTIPISRLKTKIRLHEIISSNSLPTGIEYRPLRHSINCYGYRLLAEDKIVSYCTDTGLCKNLYYLAEKSDLFITECSYKSRQDNKDWPHLNPESAAKAAVEAGAKKMVLIHFDAGLYLNLKDREEAGKASRKIFKNTLISYDNMKIDL
jgi:ribonuclease BN (tRNA processing enzyme)